ncbi:MAG: hypothetical protein L6Q83_10590 [Gammaproteobacteria bacterium]|nr:hypothetical protein [Gammaproteobacteria bacterium]
MARDSLFDSATRSERATRAGWRYGLAVVLTGAVFGFAQPLPAATILWDEAVSGDLPNGSLVTLTAVAGTNTVIGSSPAEIIPNILPDCCGGPDLLLQENNHDYDRFWLDLPEGGRITAVTISLSSGPPTNPDAAGAMAFHVGVSNLGSLPFVVASESWNFSLYDDGSPYMTYIDPLTGLPPTDWSLFVSQMPLLVGDQRFDLGGEIGCNSSMGCYNYIDYDYVMSFEVEVEAAVVPLPPAALFFSCALAIFGVIRRPVGL